MITTMMIGGIDSNFTLLVKKNYIHEQLVFSLLICCFAPWCYYYLSDITCYLFNSNLLLISFSILLGDDNNDDDIVLEELTPTITSSKRATR